MKKYLLKYSLEFLVIVMGISVSFWLSNVKDQSFEIEKEKEILTSLHLNLTEVKTSLDQRVEMLIVENNLMDYLSENWNNVNIDSIALELENGRHVKSFHNIFLDYREFHPPITEINSLVSDGSISYINNKEIKLNLSSLLNISLDFIVQNINSEIELQQSFREILLTTSSEEISDILKTSQTELKDRFSGSKNYKNKIKNELTSILKFLPAENYLNLKIRQRYWVMFFMEQFKNQLETLDNLILLEMELN